MRTILLTVLAFAALAGTAQAKPHVRDCPNGADTEFTYHVQVRGISCSLARYVIEGVSFNEDTFEFVGPNPWWKCRQRDTGGLAYGGKHLRCTLGSSDVRWTSRLF